MVNNEDVDRVFKIYELEYKASAERYENIYRAIWQNFSYMAALSAGILAFGSKSLGLSVVLILACIPLLFWFDATYLPMDHYARGARRRAAELEQVISVKWLGEAAAERSTVREGPFYRWGAVVGSFRWLVLLIALLWIGAGVLAFMGGLEWSHERSVRGGVLTLAACVLAFGVPLIHWNLEGGPRDTPAQTSMQHYRDFGAADPSVHWRKANLLPYWHVNQVVLGAFASLTVLWIAIFPVAARRLAPMDTGPKNLATEPDTLSVQVITPQLRHLSQQLIQINASLDTLRGRSARADTLLTAMSRHVRCSGKDSGGPACK